MDPIIIPLEPERANKMLLWWSDAESGTLLECLEKSRSHALIRAAALQAKAVASSGNQNFDASARDELNQAAEFETTIAVLKAFLPDGPFIARIEL